ncbi:MAG: hypothetical protein ACRD29_25065 [Acidimicrobiales bacterium]
MTVGSMLTVLVRGRLDATAGTALLDTVRAGLVPGTERLAVDLREIDDFTDEGAATLVECRSLGDALVDGVHYRTSTGAGSDALLVAFASNGDRDTVVGDADAGVTS